ncbi:DUF3310 domain-containing protein [uncultured Mitsuokella sp.]|uniref:DUF3310 domain-containing protein n=1 Tax=uncultured Mitsuokella sp. TaxID=453120 RepID=UPI0025F509BD|nr:DUF3310 domain-containing protein [uncultured Mitsuokella sp.]
MNKEYVEGFRVGYANATMMLTAKEAVLPRPCDGPLYERWSPDTYANKLEEEIDEVNEALFNWEQTKGTLKEVGEELTDVIIISTSFLNALGFDYAARQKLMREKNESNGKRDGGKRFAQPQSVTLETEKAKTKAPEKVKHPAYYKRGIECIDYINSHNFNFCLGNAIKYITRAGYKTDDPREDLRKAIQYLEFELERIEKEGEGK